MHGNEIKHICAWLPIPVVAVVNGSLRDLVYGKLMNETLAHSLSVVPLRHNRCSPTLHGID